jgi:prepilin-type N-terminal cleavage/methylation domain-containing protein
MHVTRDLRAVRRPVVGDERGFTLIELMVTILIAGILAAIAVPIFLSAVDQARASGVEAALANARLELAGVLVTDGSLPTILAEDEVVGDYGDPAISIQLVSSDDQFCLIGTHDLLTEVWAASRTAPPTLGAGCAPDGLIILP